MDSLCWRMSKEMTFGWTLDKTCQLNIIFCQNPYLWNSTTLFWARVHRNGREYVMHMTPTCIQISPVWWIVDLKFWCWLSVSRGKALLTRVYSPHWHIGASKVWCLIVSQSSILTAEASVELVTKSSGSRHRNREETPKTEVGVGTVIIHDESTFGTCPEEITTSMDATINSTDVNHISDVCMPRRHTVYRQTFELSP